MKIEVVQCGMCNHYDSEQYCEVWEQYITNDAFYCACGVKADRKTENCSEIPNNCDKPQYDFGEYADRLWKIAYERGKREALEQTEPSCDTCKLKDTTEWCKRQEVCRAYQPKDKPQTEEEYINNLPWTEVGNGEQTDDAYFLELMGAVERGEISDAGANQAWYEYINHKDEPQTEEPPMDEYYKDHDEFYDCDRYVITNDEGERAYNCIGCQTDCPWK